MARIGLLIKFFVSLGFQDSLVVPVFLSSSSKNNVVLPDSSLRLAAILPEVPTYYPRLRKSLARGDGFRLAGKAGSATHESAVAAQTETSIEPGQQYVYENVGRIQACYAMKYDVS